MEITSSVADNVTDSVSTYNTTDAVMAWSRSAAGLINNRTLVLDMEWQRYLRRNIPITVYLGLIGLIGSVGNVHVFLVYYLRYKRSNHRTFVLWLSIVDLLACALVVPFEIVDTRYNYTFDSKFACKAFRFLAHFVSACSGCLLGVIAVERHLKACRPMGRQFTVKEAKWACVVTVIVCAILAFPSLFFYGLNEEIIDGNLFLVGTDCTVLNQIQKTSYFKGYNFILLFICTSIFVLCVVLYSLIGRVLYRQMLFRRSSQTKNPKQRLTSLSSSEGDGVLTKKKYLENGSFGEDESSIGNHSNGISGKASSPTSPSTSSFKLKFPQSFRKKRLFNRSTQITYMFLVTTAVSYIGYLPYLILVLLQAINKGAYDRMSITLGPFNSILMRGYFLNNCTNPIVYSFMDERFRSECKNLYRRVWRKVRFALRCGRVAR